jgi:hypothetical protein
LKHAFVKEAEAGAGRKLTAAEKEALRKQFPQPQIDSSMKQPRAQNEVSRLAVPE